MENIIIIESHPDDAFLGCGAYICSNKHIYNFYIFCVSSKDENGNEYTQRKKEEILVCEKLGVNLEWFDGIDTILGQNENCIIRRLENEIKVLNPKIIFAPFYCDTHQDHRVVSNATVSASRYYRNIIFYETPSTINFDAKLYFEFNDECLALKEKLSGLYESQILYGSKLYEYIRAKAISNGTKSRVCKYAEGFIPFKYFF